MVILSLLLLPVYRILSTGAGATGSAAVLRSITFPEEMNRRLTGALATFHFAPTRVQRST